MEIENLKKELRAARRKMSDMAMRDELTGLYNRRYFMEALERERARAERHGQDLSLCMMDLDSFKRVNDKLGKTAGDLLLADVGRIIMEWSRRTDVPCRFGGEEFAVILPETAHEGRESPVKDCAAWWGKTGCNGGPVPSGLPSVSALLRTEPV